MILFPAVDILQGKAVRLAQGAFDARTEYDADPLDAALRWVAAGARALHVVDLDGARTGEPANLEHVRRIAAAVDVPVQVGGGLRTLEAVRTAAQSGATRVVLGTAALRDVDLLDAAVSELDDRIVVSLDARDGKLAAAGWVQQTDIPLESVIGHLGARGVRRYVFSSIDRDGMMAGPDLEGARRVAESVRGNFIYSGGVASLEDLQALQELRAVNLEGVIVGRAIYEGRLEVGAAQALLDRRR